MREGSILFVVILSNGDDDHSEWNLETWRGALSIAKSHHEEAILVLGIFSDQDLADPVCAPEGPVSEAEPAPSLREFGESYGDKGQFCSVCANNYTPCFELAADGVTAACESFVEP